MKIIASFFLAIWITTRFDTAERYWVWLDPVYTFGIFTLAICIQARGRREREQGVPLAMWLLVPICCELIIACVYMFTPQLGNRGVQYFVNIGFYIEVITVILVGLKRLRVLPTGVTARLFLSLNRLPLFGRSFARARHYVHVRQTRMTAQIVQP